MQSRIEILNFYVIAPQSRKGMEVNKCTNVGNTLLKVWNCLYDMFLKTHGRGYQLQNY